MYHNSHETIYAQVFLKRINCNTHFFWSEWWTYSAKSYFGSTSGSCSSYSIHWRSKLCAVLLITDVSAFMLLMTSLWHLTMFRYVSRYVLYRDLCIEIWIVSWGTCIVTPLTRGCPYDNLRCSLWWHYNDVIMDTMASQITSLPIINSTVYSRLRSKEHQSSASLAFVWGIHHWLVNSPHKGPVTWQMFPLMTSSWKYSLTWWWPFLFNVFTGRITTLRPQQNGRNFADNNYHKTSNISRTLVGNKIDDNSDVVGASPVGAAPTTSSFST